MTSVVRMVEIGSSGCTQKEHLKKLKEVLRTTQDPVLKAHMRQLMRAWGVRVRLPKVPVAA